MAIAISILLKIFIALLLPILETRNNSAPMPPSIKQIIISVDLADFPIILKKKNFNYFFFPIYTLRYGHKDSCPDFPPNKNFY